MTALGIGAGVNYQGFVPTFSPLAGAPFPVPVNAGNQVAYDAFVMGINVNTSNDEGIWSGSRLGPTAAVREGDASAPSPPGSIYSANSGVTFNPPYINDAGQIAFRGSLGSGNVGIWSGTAGICNSVVRSGQQAPGMSTGIRFLHQTRGYMDRSCSTLPGLTGQTRSLSRRA